jgi:hypothetical protein
MLYSPIQIMDQDLGKVHGICLFQINATKRKIVLQKCLKATIMVHTKIKLLKLTHLQVMIATKDSILTSTKSLK